MEKNKRIILNSFLILSFVGVVITAILALALPINNITTFGVVEKYKNLMTPALYTFIVWIVIYALQILYILYTFGVFKRTCCSLNALNITSSLTILLNVLTIGYIISISFEVFLVSTLLSILMFIDLVLITAHILKADTRGLCCLLIYVPFVVFTAWMGISMFINIANLITAINWTMFGWSFAAWASILIALATILSIIFAIFYRSIYYAITVLWGLFGIMIGHLMRYGQTNASVVYTLIVAMFLMILAASLIIYYSAKHKKPLLKK